VVARREDRAARALAVGLRGDRYSVGERVVDAFLRPRHGDDLIRAGGVGRVDHPLDHRPAAHGVQDLRQLRLHARALARGHDDDGEGVGHREASVAAGV
jgi:hypothetical protein